MMRSWIKIFFFAVVGALFFTTVCQSFSISPLKYHLTLTPGTSSHDVSLTVKNSSSKKQVYKIKVLGARQMESGRLAFMEKNSVAETWVRPEVDIVEILPNSEKIINFSVSVPQDALAGSHYLGLAAESVTGEAEKQVGVSGQLVSVFLLQVAGVVNESLSIDHWEVPGITVKKSWPAILSIVNTCVTELPVKGEITVRDWLGREVSRSDISFGLPLLPSSGRSFSANLDLPARLLLPGLYEAEVKVNYGLTKQTVVATKSVWYLPLYLWILLAIFSALGAVAIFRRKKV